MERIFSGVKIECVQGDIASQDGFGVVVNAANSQLRMGGGVAGAIHRAAGSELEEECRALAPIKPGEAVITSAYNLPNSYVVHCLGPIYGVDKLEDELLAKCYQCALQLADEKRVYSIAFPAISTGAFGYPIEEAAEVAIRTIRDMIPQLKYVREIRFVLHSKKDLEVFEKSLKRII